MPGTGSTGQAQGNSWQYPFLPTLDFLLIICVLLARYLSISAQCAQGEAVADGRNILDTVVGVASLIGLLAGGIWYATGLQSQLDDARAEIGNLRNSLDNVMKGALTAGAPGERGPIGPPGETPEIEIRATTEFLQWRVAGEPVWTSLAAMEDLRGEPGRPGAQGEPGVPGKDGAPAPAIELTASEDFVLWRSGQGEWIELVALEDIRGEQGPQGVPGPIGEGSSGPTEAELSTLIEELLTERLAASPIIPQLSSAELEYFLDENEVALVGPNRMPIGVNDITSNYAVFMIANEELRLDPGQRTDLADAGSSCYMTYLGLRAREEGADRVTNFLVNCAP